jgi:hypothetical protein
MTVEVHDPAPHRGAPDWLWYLGVPVVGLALYLLYNQLIPISEWVTALFPVARDSHTGEAIAFFVYDVPKVLLLLTGIVFVTGVLRSWFSTEKTRTILAGKREIWGYPLASLLGVLTPFCSCSSVPLFIGFVSAGIPLGVTFSFLIAGPMVGPVGLGLLYGLVGWQIATIMHRGAARTPGDSFVWLDERDVMFTGDIVFVDRLLGNDPARDTDSWIAEGWRTSWGKGIVEFPARRRVGKENPHKLDLSADARLGVDASKMCAESRLGDAQYPGDIGRAGSVPEHRADPCLGCSQVRRVGRAEQRRAARLEICAMLVGNGRHCAEHARDPSALSSRPCRRCSRRKAFEGRALLPGERCRHVEFKNIEFRPRLFERDRGDVAEPTVREPAQGSLLSLQARRVFGFIQCPDSPRPRPIACGCQDGRTDGARQRTRPRARLEVDRRDRALSAGPGAGAVKMDDLRSEHLGELGQALAKRTVALKGLRPFHLEQEQTR